MRKFGVKLWSTRNSILRAFKIQVWSPAGLPATFPPMPSPMGLTRSGETTREAIAAAAVLTKAAGILLQGVPAACVPFPLGAMGFPALSHIKGSRPVVGFPELNG